METVVVIIFDLGKGFHNFFHGLHPSVIGVFSWLDVVALRSPGFCVRIVIQVIILYRFSMRQNSRLSWSSIESLRQRTLRSPLRLDLTSNFTCSVVKFIQRFLQHLLLRFLRLPIINLFDLLLSFLFIFVVDLLENTSSFDLIVRITLDGWVESISHVSQSIRICLLLFDKV